MSQVVSGILMDFHIKIIGNYSPQRAQRSLREEKEENFQITLQYSHNFLRKSGIN